MDEESRNIPKIVWEIDEYMQRLEGIWGGIDRSKVSSFSENGDGRLLDMCMY